MPLLTREFRQTAGIFTRNFFRELYDRLKTPFTLVFDNYQEVPAESDLNQIMPLAFAELPHEGHVIVISRDEPPSNFAKLRADRAMELVEYPELRFTEQETRQLIGKFVTQKLPKSTIDERDKNTEGWAAGLVLSLDQMQHQEKASQSAIGSSGVVFDYFAGEVLKRADRRTQEVLCETAFLPRISASMAGRLSRRSDACQIIARLHRENFFTIKLPGPEPTYEFHPLFRAFLLSRAQTIFSPVRLKEIRRKSAELLQHAGEAEAAVMLLRDAEAWADLSKVICKHAPEFFAQGRVETIEQWIRGIPAAWVDSTPWLLVWRGACRVGRSNKAARDDCERALAAFRETLDAAGAYFAWSTIVATYEFEGAHESLVPWVAVFNELRREFPQFPSIAIEARVAHAVAESLVYLQPYHQDAEYWISRAVELAQERRNLQALSAFTWWRYYWIRGDHSKAGFVADPMARLMNNRSTPPLTGIVAGFTVAAHQYLNADPRCRETIAELLHKVDQLGLPYAFKNLLLTIGLASALSDGEAATSARWLEENQEGLKSEAWGQRFHSLWTSIWAGLVLGDIAHVGIYLAELLNTKEKLRGTFWQWLAGVLIAKVFHRLGKLEKAETHLAEALAFVTSVRSPYMEFTTRLTQAEIYFDSGRETEGFEMLRLATALGKAGNYITSETWIPAVMARLCAKALEAGIEVEYVRMLVGKRNLVPEEPPFDIDTWPWPIRIYTLGQFHVLKDDQPLRFSHKVQRKPLALLKTIIALGGQKVREEILLDTLWPDSDGDTAGFALNSAIHRLRKLLAREDAIIRQDNEVTLNARCCWLDLLAVERLLEKAETIPDHDEKASTLKFDLINRAAHASLVVGNPEHRSVSISLSRLLPQFLVLYGIGSRAGRGSTQIRPLTPISGSILESNTDQVSRNAFRRSLCRGSFDYSAFAYRQSAGCHWLASQRGHCQSERICRPIQWLSGSGPLGVDRLWQHVILVLNRGRVLPVGLEPSARTSKVGVWLDELVLSGAASGSNYFSIRIYVNPFSVSAWGREQSCSPEYGIGAGASKDGPTHPSGMAWPVCLGLDSDRLADHTLARD